jgi:hypothetical protein
VRSPVQHSISQNSFDEMRNCNPKHILSLRFLFRCAFLLFLFPASAVAQNPAGINWHYHSSASIVVAYREADQTLALRVLSELQQRQQLLARRLEYQPRRVITVFLCPTPAIFDHMTGGGVPHWGEAAANTAQWRIYLKTPAASDSRELLPVTVTHELAHLCLAEIASPNQLPRWFNEGAAIFLSNEPRHADPTIISRALLTNSLVDFEEIDDLLTFPNARAALAYAESYHAVNFMAKRFGSGAIRKFAQTLGQTPDTREAFQNACGEDLWNFEAEYFDFLRQQFRWYFLLDESVLFGGAILILVIAGFFVTRWRTRKKVKEWEVEDRDDEEEPLPPEIDGDKTAT